MNKLGDSVSSLTRLAALLMLAAAVAASRPGRPAAGPFDVLEKKATAAREQNRLTEAVDLYKRALKLRPAWREGLWYLGTLLYEQDHYAEARSVLERYTKAEPGSGPAWTLLGLCQFRAGDYKLALRSLRRGATLGLRGNEQMQAVSRYHQVLLLNRLGEHETAWPVLTVLARQPNETPQLIEAAGLTALRMQMLPGDIPADKRELVLSAGRALMLALARNPAAAQRAFEELVSAYPREPNVHYAYASFLLAEHPDLGITQLQRELEISPDHVPALVSLAFEHLKRKDTTAALPYARRAAAVAPDNFAARSALGRVLVEAGHLEAGATELEAAARLAPDSPQVRFALAGAYRKLGRSADAEREQTEFLRLKKVAGDTP